MSDYIKRKDVLALIDDFELTLPDDEIFFSYIPVKAVEELPAADVVERKHGKWEHKQFCSNLSGYEYACSCSICEKPTYRISLLERMPNFCPNCGSDMRGER